MSIKKHGEIADGDPAFVSYSDPRVENGNGEEPFMRSLFLVARASDLECHVGCLAAAMCDLAKFSDAENILVDRERMARAFASNHRDRFTLRPLFTDMPYDIYPVAPAVLDLVRPALDAIERFYERR